MTAQPPADMALRATPATRRKYAVIFAAVIVTPLACAAVYTALKPEARVAGWLSGVILALLLAATILLDRLTTSFRVRGGLLRSRMGGRGVDLTRVIEASVEVKDPKWMVPRNPYSTLILMDCVGGRIHVVFSTKRIQHLYEPADVRVLADALARSDSTSAQDVARRLHTFTEEAARTRT